MKVTIINTGGTFNKRYNPLKGQLEVPSDNIALDKIIASCHNVEFEIKNIVSKDSLDMTDEDRELITNTVKNSKNENIIIIHGTDTVDLTAAFLRKQIADKRIVFTGAMIPFSVDETEASFNLGYAVACAQALGEGSYVAMNGQCFCAGNVEKNLKTLKFEKKNE